MGLHALFCALDSLASGGSAVLVRDRGVVQKSITFFLMSSFAYYLPDDDLSP